jgi:hypothetical protein
MNIYDGYVLCSCLESSKQANKTMRSEKMKISKEEKKREN